jgi:glycosyltransferase involved in cell wall biosynthesis/predicted deacetylase
MKYKIEKYPFNKDCVVAITIDDLHPENASYKNKLNFGYDFNERFWTQIFKTKEKFKEIKFTIFTVANWIDRSDYPSGVLFPLRKIYRKRQSYEKDIFNLDQKEYADWINQLNEISKDQTIEYAMHGLYHHNPTLNGAHSQEFLNLNNSEFTQTIDQMFEVFKKSGLNFSKGFRPPGWGLNSEKIKLLEENNIKYIAASSDFETPIENKLTNAAGLKEVNIFEPTEFNKIQNFNANCYPHQYNRAAEIAQQNGIVIVHCHVAPTEFGLKYVDTNFEKNISKLIREIKFQTGKTIWFATLSEISDYTQNIKNIRHSVTNNRIRIENLSDKEISGLTLTINNRKHVINKILPKQVIEIDPTSYRQENTKVSAILTVYNGAKNVLPSLQSLCDQSYKNLEIIVVNDGSTDNTTEVLSDFIRTNQDTKVKIITQQNGGRSKARNTGFKMSNGEIITFCEDDALYSKDYIKNGISHFKDQNNKLGGVIGPHYVWNRTASLNTLAKDIERRRNFDNYKPKSCWFYRREIFEHIGLFNENIELIEDVEPAIKLAREGYFFEFEPNSIWLHKEPASLKKYLRRKYRGGIGMALMKKVGLRETIVPTKFIVISLAALLVLVSLLFTSTFYFVLLLSFAPAALLLLRFKDYVRSISLSAEPIHIIMLSIYIEYLWWFATLLGYLKGTTMSESEINKLLKGR